MPPMRVKSRPQQVATEALHSPSSPALVMRSEAAAMPEIAHDDSFRDVVKKLSIFIADAIVLPCSFEQLRTTSAGDRLRSLVTHLGLTCDNPCIVNALLALRWHYGAANDDRSLSDARANACEIVAWRFLTHLSEREAVDFCLYEIPATKKAPGGVSAAAARSIASVDRSGIPTGDSLATFGDEEDVRGSYARNGSDGDDDDDARHAAPAAPTESRHRPSQTADETAPLLARMWSSATVPSDRSHKGAQSATTRRSGAGTRRYQLLQSISRLTMSMHVHSHRHDSSDSDCDSEDEDADCSSDDDGDDPTAAFVHLNALEIAAVADAKRFLSQNVVQKIITGIWNGDIVFWDRLEVGAVKMPRFYNPLTADPFSRLRVPKYLKMFEALFFFTFLVIFYLTLLARSPSHISVVEVFFYIFLAAFAYDELSEWIDAGSLFYVYDFWNLFDLIMICIGFVFVVLRIAGLSWDDPYLIDLSFDILSLEALFMVPRISSILSLSPYWGTLIPCFKEMTKDFIKFMVLVVIIYMGFLTTFSLLGRAVFTLPHMTMILTKIFFGSSYVGFDIMEDIDPVFGPPLMLVFVTLSSILLMGSLTGMLSNSFSRVMGHAREEYLYVYSIYVLEASTSNRLTHFYPPLNLIALVIFRPLRLFLPSDRKFRAARIALLKITHLPIVGAIQLYELIRGKIQNGADVYSADHVRHRHQTPALVSYGHHNGDGAAMVTPKRSAMRTRSLARSSRPWSTSEFGPRLTVSGDSLKAGAVGAVSGSSSAPSPSPRPRPPLVDLVAAVGVEDTEIDVPSDVEVRITELSAKIDKLTELVLQLQAQKTPH